MCKEMQLLLSNLEVLGLTKYRDMVGKETTTNTSALAIYVLPLMKIIIPKLMWRFWYKTDIS